MPQVMLFNKPFQVLSQFTDSEGRQHLGDFIDVPGYYAAGRLDYDSEGLMVLTDHGPTQHLISGQAMEKTYLVQVEGRPVKAQLDRLRQGVSVKDYVAKAVAVEMLSKKPGWLWPRTPPIRQRKNSPTSWMQVTLNQGKNRQVRRMCAAVGLPVLRLLRTRVGPFQLHDLTPGQFVLKDFSNPV